MVSKKTEEESITPVVAPGDEYRARKRRALQQLRETLAVERLSFRDLLDEWIQEGVERGLVTLGEERMAVANGTWGYDREKREVIDKRKFREQSDDVDVLKWLLERGDMQRAAKLKLAVDDRNDALLYGVVALPLARDFDAIANGCASDAVVRRIAPIMAVISRYAEGGELWQHGLNNAVYVTLARSQRAPSEDVVAEILAALRGHVPEEEIPARLRSPPKARTNDAVSRLAKFWDPKTKRYRVHLTVYNGTEPARFGKGHITAWGLARLLAHDLGGYDVDGDPVVSFPKWEDLGRDRKAERALSPKPRVPKHRI